MEPVPVFVQLGNAGDLLRDGIVLRRLLDLGALSLNVSGVSLHELGYGRARDLIETSYLHVSKPINDEVDHFDTMTL